MNISSVSHTAFSSVSNVANTNAAATLRVGQSQIENRGAIFQPIDEVPRANNNPADTIIAVAGKTAGATPNNSVQNLTGIEQQSLRNRREQDQQQAQQESLERQQIQALVARDREVRHHERAHAAVGGQYTGSPRYVFERGPDGINYAVAGEVSISTGAIPGDPQATIQKAQIIRRAALAPLEPSAQDRSVAAQSVQLEAAARVEIQNQQVQERIEIQKQSEARAEQRDESFLLQERELGDNAESATVQTSLQEATEADIEQGAQRLSDVLSLRIREAGLFGVGPGQRLDQFI